MGGITILCNEHTFLDLTSRLSEWILMKWISEYTFILKSITLISELTDSTNEEALMRGKNKTCVILKLLARVSLKWADQDANFYKHKNGISWII
jgi:hypothetical protein